MKKQAATSTQGPAEAVFHSLLSTWGLLRQAQEPYFARFGISGSQWGILRVLQRGEAQGEIGLPLGEMSERLLIQPPSVTGVVDRMERQGLVKRSQSKTDLRIRLLSLTPQGRDLVEKVLSGHAERVKLLLAGIPEGDQDAMLRALAQVRTNLSALVSTLPKGGTKSGKPAGK